MYKRQSYNNVLFYLIILTCKYVNVGITVRRIICLLYTSSDFANGGGVFVNSSRSFVMSNEAKIEGCQAISNSSRGRGDGGGVYLTNNTKFTLSGSAVIQNCTATNSANHGEAYGGGVSADCVKEITLADSACIVGCTAANGSGLYITGSQVPGYGILHANGGSVDGDVVLGDTEDGPCTITGSGGTEMCIRDSFTIACHEISAA